MLIRRVAELDSGIKPVMRRRQHQRSIALSAPRVFSLGGTHDGNGLLQMGMVAVFVTPTILHSTATIESKDHG